MALVINTNIASLNAQRQLSSTGQDLDRATERLASGQRINSAKDDAAGLAISNRFTSQIRGLDQAVRNANDGISLIQTAEGALQEATNILQRQRELAIQSANGIFTDSDRQTLDAEVQQLKTELDRIANETTFNGKALLDGSLGATTLQVGSEQNQTIDVSIGSFNIEDLGGVSSGDVVGAEAQGGTLLAALNAIDGVPGTASGNAQLNINGQSVGDLSAESTLGGALDTINSNIAGVEASAFTELTAVDEGDGILRDGDTITLTLTDLDGNPQAFTIGNTGSLDELVGRINSDTGGQISAEVNDNGRVVLSNSEGGTIAVTDSAGNGTVANTALGTTAAATTTQQAQLVFNITDSNVENVDIDIVAFDAAELATVSTDLGINERTDSDITGLAIADGSTAAINEGDLSLNGVAIGAVADGTTGAGQASNLVTAINEVSDETGVVASANGAVLTLNSVDGSEITIDFKDGGAASTATTGLLETNNSSVLGNAVADLDISTQAGAQEAIGILDRAIEDVGSTRADLGAVNNRLDFTISNLSNVSEKTSAARSRILDADFAAETAELSRAQVLQQAASAMLAQANARPQQALQLLN